MGGVNKTCLIIINPLKYLYGILFLSVKSLHDLYLYPTIYYPALEKKKYIEKIYGAI